MLICLHMVPLAELKAIGYVYPLALMFFRFNFGEYRLDLMDRSIIS